jgi:hypothetical protein
VDFAGSKAENNTNNNTENADITDFTSESDSLPF